MVVVTGAPGTGKTTLSLKLLYFFTEKLLLSGNPFIVEGNFINDISTECFLDIKSKLDFQVLQIYCHTQDEVLYERFISRDASGLRHPGHIGVWSSIEQFKAAFIDNKQYKLDIEGSIYIDIYTTKFENVNLQQVYGKFEKTIKYIKSSDNA